MKPKKWYKDKSRKEIAGLSLDYMTILTCMKDLWLEVRKRLIGCHLLGHYH